MSRKSYSDKLRDPRWQKRRLERLQATEFTCLNCGDGSTELHVHHLLYERGKDPWDYPDNLLLPLCKDCHESVDSLQKDITRALAEFSPAFLGDINAALCDVSERCFAEHSFKPWEIWIKSARFPSKKPKVRAA